MTDPRILMRQPYSNSGFLGMYHFARLRLRTGEDGMVLPILVLPYILYTVRIGTSKKGGNAPRATDKKSM